MFPALVELVVLSCSQLTFKPSLPRCMRYEIRDSNNILSCGQPLGPSSSPSPRNIEISGCLVPSSSSGTNISHELTTQGGAPKDTGSGSSIIRKLLPKLNSTLARSVDPGLSWKVSTPSKETPSTFQNPSRFKMSAEIPRVKSLSLKQIQKATRKFSPSFMLGEGRIWTVYKAVLPDNNHIVAVRRAKKGCIQDAKNLMEPELLANFNHWSLVGFLGFIDKGSEFLMISEYVPNGTLRKHLDGQDVRILDFNQRVVIAMDVAIALTYLHVSSEEPVICYNLKTANILLMDSYRAKVCACELSVCGPSEIKGTMGYIDPEYFQTCELTAKSDVFSFGIVLLELLSSRKPMDYFWHDNIGRIEEWALEEFNQGHVNEILDCRLKGEVDEKVLRDWLSLALSCASYSSSDRPNIEEAGGRLWKIWKDHRNHIGEPYEYQRSWAEFVKMGGIPMADESQCEGLDMKFPTPSARARRKSPEWRTREGQGLPGPKWTEEASTVHYLSRPGSPDSMTIYPR